MPEPTSVGPASRPISPTRASDVSALLFVVGLRRFPSQSLSLQSFVIFPEGLLCFFVFRCCATFTDVLKCSSRQAYLPEGASTREFPGAFPDPATPRRQAGPALLAVMIGNLTAPSLDSTAQAPMLRCTLAFRSAIEVCSMRDFPKILARLQAFRSKFDSLLAAARKAAPIPGPAGPPTRLREVSGFGTNPGNFVCSPTLQRTWHQTRH
jgi:hypothetical protein